MDKLRELQLQEADIIKNRERLKQEINEMSVELHNIRQRIKYMKKTEGKNPSGLLYEMFGKRLPELTAEELREYNRIMQEKRRKK